jgi:hypothetical protein
MCGRVIQGSGPLRYAIVGGMNVRDSRVHVTGKSQSVGGRTAAIESEQRTRKTRYRSRKVSCR